MVEARDITADAIEVVAKGGWSGMMAEEPTDFVLCMVDARKQALRTRLGWGFAALTAAGWTLAPPGSRVVPEGWDDRAIASLRRAVDLAEAMLTNDPNEPISDAGHTLLEWWQSEIEVLRAALRALAEAKP